MQYLFTAYVCVLLLIVVPPLWMLLLVLPDGRWPGVFLRMGARLVIRASGCRLRVLGAETLGRAIPAVIVANHTSYLDAIILMAALPIECCFVANHALAKVPFVRTAIRKAGYLTVNRARLRARAECVLEMMRIVRRGTSVVIFPEGTTSRTRDLLPFRLGAFRVAIETDRPIVPVTVRGSSGIWPRGTWLMRAGAIEVRIHTPLETAAHGRNEMTRIRDRSRAVMGSSLNALEARSRPTVW